MIAMVPMTRFTKMKREEGVNHVAMILVGSAMVVNEIDSLIWRVSFTFQG